MGLKEDPQNFLLMHAVGVNVSGQIASALAAVSKIKAVSPSRTIISVSHCRNSSARSLEATVIPKRMVIKLVKTFCAVSERESSTPHSRSRFPNIKKPINATLLGANRPAITVMVIGGLNCFCSGRRL